MRILVGTGLNYGAAEYQNIGDIAMLQVAVTRLSEQWPNAEILVFTESAAGLARFCPAAKPLARDGAEIWGSDRVLLGKALHQRLPASFSVRLSDAKSRIVARNPALVRSLLRARFRIRDTDGRLEKVESFLSTLQSSDLLVISGSGGFADSCRGWNYYTLGLMNAALAFGVKVALFGQGVGPLGDREVLARMRQILPKVALFSSRGTQGAEPIAREIGIPNDVFITTGDETVEPAYQARPLVPGRSIGINLRLASYSGVTEVDADALGRVLRDFAESKNTSLLPLPIATHACANDRKSILRLLGEDDGSDPMSLLDSPERIYEQTAKCRVVVSGAYHAAVFALSQGIPAICLSGSEYYRNKFEGLKVLFGEGCKVVNLQQSDAVVRLSDLLQSAWTTADNVRPELIDAALRQIAASRKAYLRLRDMLPGTAESIRANSAAVSIP